MRMLAGDDIKFMAAALEAARRGLGNTSPNPAVGAVLVDDDRKVISTGYHHRAGGPHAEIECLRGVTGRLPRITKLYVTLEPCSSTGRTPPCTDMIIAAGIKEVTIGAIDPNPGHAGRGVEILRKAGVTVRTGVLAKECSALNEAWNKWITTRRPFVIAKCGMSLDGRLTKPPGESRFLTGMPARRHAHALRAQVDAILIGAETLRADNPRLTARGVGARKQPWRIVLSRSRKLPRAHHLFSDHGADRTRVYHENLPAVLADLGAREITSVLIEGGGDVLGQALDARMIDKVQLYFAPVFSGGPTVAFAASGVTSTAEAPRLRDVQYQRVGDDICLTGYPTYPNADLE